MKEVALTQAMERLTRARNALQRMKEAKSYNSTISAWSDFLLASSGIYSKLEQGVKGCRVSEGWFGCKKHDRRKDELLRYLYHARNADEHGLSGTALYRADIKIIRGNVHSIDMQI